ncbi:MAG TPA: glycosyltransferase 87 family protein [Candidatus Thermoplasmatota archaeon]|nr:glycosyltransferase 87 family protein [Candidatus Thermoplasmatota archaeon]
MPGPGTAPTAAQAPWRRPPWWRRDYLVALLLGLFLAAVFQHDWDGFVFQTAVREFLHGHSPYTVAQHKPFYAFLGPTDTETQWYAYPPLPLLAMAVTYAPAVLLHLDGTAIAGTVPAGQAFLVNATLRILLKLPLVLATLSLAAVAGAWTRRLGSPPDEVRKVERRFLFNPFLMLVGCAWGMTDTALMALYMGGILAYRNGKPGKAGALVALATLIKPFPLLLMLPIVPYLLDRHGWRAFWRFVGAGLATAAPIVLPFLLTQPAGFWQQSIGMHLARLPQGVTPWTLWPLRLMSPQAISVTSLVLMCGSLLLVGWAATKLRARGTSLMLTLLAGIAVLVWNRVLNEQYLVMVVAPLLILDQVHELDRFGHFLTRWTPTVFAIVVAFGGFHFLTFLPPDVAMPLLHEPVDVVAQHLRDAMPWFWKFWQGTLEFTIAGTLIGLGVLGARLVAKELRSDPGRPVRRHFAPIASACALLLMVGLVPALGASAAPVHAFQPAHPEAKVAAFYYLWWQNPAHDPSIPYGNWPVVSQVPEIGYYTNNRGVARDHAAQMVGAGIDTAIVSYHRGEYDRYRTFQEEAGKAGLRVAPLIELNQVYDQPAHHPVDETGASVPYAAYRLDNGTRAAVEQFVLDLKPLLADPATLRADGRPVVYFYDSYVSGMGFDKEDKEDLARVALDLYPLAELRSRFNDSALQPTLASLLRHYPGSIVPGFFLESAAASTWREAHLELHRRFWTQLRLDLEREVGPLYLVSGEAYNENAGFDAGTAKDVVDLEVFDGAFIYSPSFTWGNHKGEPFGPTFEVWEDRNAWLTAFAAGRGRTSHVGIAPSYDDTVNRPDGFRIPPFVNGQSFYGLSWDSALRHPPTQVAIATFNEFFEGSSIEPSRGDGTRLLDETRAQRGRYLAASEEGPTTVAVLHERSSRTNIHYSERDPSHEWGLDLVAAGSRALPGPLAAIDALAPSVPDLAPGLLLVEGGHGDFDASPAALRRLAGWSGSARTIFFGSDLAAPLAAAMGDNCLAGLDAVPYHANAAGLADHLTLRAGDRLHGVGTTLMLERGGHDYRVGQACDGGRHAGTSIKPYGASPGTDGTCLGVAIRILQPAAAKPGPMECTV